MLCTKVLWQQRWRQYRCGDGVAERMVGGKVGSVHYLTYHTSFELVMKALMVNARPKLITL